MADLTYARVLPRIRVPRVIHGDSSVLKAPNDFREDARDLLERVGQDPVGAAVAIRHESSRDNREAFNSSLVDGHHAVGGSDLGCGHVVVNLQVPHRRSVSGDTCPWCPFEGCTTCSHQSGTDRPREEEQ